MRMSAQAWETASNSAAETRPSRQRTITRELRKSGNRPACLWIIGVARDETMALSGTIARVLELPSKPDGPETECATRGPRSRHEQPAGVQRETDQPADDRAIDPDELQVLADA